MSTSVTLPALGESVTEGTVTRWLKQVGDTVEADEPLLEVSTDKVDTEIPSPTSGVLLEIKAQEDETVEVGAELAVIGDANEAAGDSGSADSAGASAGAADQQVEQTSAPAFEPEPAGEQDASIPALDEETPAPQTEAKPAAGGGTEVVLPALGESVTEGTVTRWLKKVGDSVEADEPLLEVSTDKVDTEIPSPTSGTLLEIRVQDDESVEVGAVLAIVGDQSAAPAGGDSGGDSGTAPSAAPRREAPPEAQPETQPQAETQAAPEAAPVSGLSEPEVRGNDQKQPGTSSTPTPSRAPDPAPAGAPAPTPPTAATPSASSDADATYVTPLVRKLAAEHSVELSAIKGTGVGGRIRKQDVLAAAEAAKAAPAPTPEAAPAAAVAAPAATPVEPSTLRGTTEKMSRLRKTIAKRMVESLQTSAQLTTVVEVDLTRISRLRARVKDDFFAREGVKLSYLPFLVKASVEALKVHPKVNCTVDTEAGEIHYPASENVAIAVDTEKGLIVPVVRDAGDLSIAGIAKKTADLASRTRSNKLSPDDLVGGTFTITNTGSRGALFDTPIINQPQVAILGTGALVKRAVVMSDPDLGETIAVRDMMYLALSYDHRVVDGADAARFLSTLKDRLEGGDFGSEFGV